MKLDLRILRKKAELSQSDLAKKFNTSHTQIARMERNPEKVSYENIMKWYEFCNVETSFMVMPILHIINNIDNEDIRRKEAQAITRFFEPYLNAA